MTNRGSGKTVKAWSKEERMEELLDTIDRWRGSPPSPLDGSGKEQREGALRAIARAIEDAVAGEREACAKVAEETLTPSRAGDYIAHTIRARAVSREGDRG